ncbi:MAG: alanyl-tRNA editing protein [Lachnospiraceae bacterium]|nr:alanyl-tRNA editing protein [Lachnospiraceae bacterium]
MTETFCLYDKEPYETEFTARVMSCEQDGDRHKIVLDATQFFPEQGGQTPDRGILGDANVLDVQIQNGIITHFTDKPLNPGEEVTGQVDWDYRFSNMQQHTGEHIFSGLTHARYGYDNVGFHLSDSVVTMDFDGSLTGEQVQELEMEVNEVIWKNLPVEVTFPDDETLKNLPYRSKKELEGPIRIVTIPGVDVCACCAPHVRYTGEIGVFKVMSYQSYKGGVRISMLCGKRAFEAIQSQQQVVTTLMNDLSSSQEDLPQHVERLQKECQDLRYTISEIREQMVMEQVEKVPENQENVLIFMDGLDARGMRNGVNKLMEKHPGFCGVFSGTDEAGYQCIIGSKNLNCKDLAIALRQEVKLRGGGSEAMIQGSLPDVKQAIFDTISHYHAKLTH